MAGARVVSLVDNLWRCVRIYGFGQRIVGEGSICWKFLVRFAIGSHAVAVSVDFLSSLSLSRPLLIKRSLFCDGLF